MTASESTKPVAEIDPPRVRVALDPGFVAQGLLPGRYQIRADIYTIEGQINATHPELFDLSPATELTRVFAEWKKD